MKAFRGLGAILFKEFIIVLRDPLTLFFMLFPPLIEMVAFGYALDNDVKHMALAVFDESRTAESRRLIDKFENTQRITQRLFGGQRDDGVDLGINPLDLRQVCAHDFDRR